MSLGAFSSKEHKKRCAEVGLLIMRDLFMEDATPAEVAKRVKDMASGLRVISTWAACDDQGRQSRLEAMEDIRNRAEESLGREVR